MRSVLFASERYGFINVRKFMYSLLHICKSIQFHVIRQVTKPLLYQKTTYVGFLQKSSSVNYFCDLIDLIMNCFLKTVRRSRAYIRTANVLREEFY